MVCRKVKFFRAESIIFKDQINKIYNTHVIQTLLTDIYAHFMNSVSLAEENYSKLPRGD